MRIVDLSHTITSEMPRFTDEWPAPRIAPWLSHQQAAESGTYQGCTCEITEVRFVTSLGTYLDSPYHFDPRGQSIEKLKLEQLVLPGVVIDCTSARARQPLGPEVLAGIDLAGKAVLFHTGWSRYWGEPHYFDFPFLTGEIAQSLLTRGARLAGVDFLIVDDPKDPRRPVHVALLHNEVLIVENLTCLDALPESGFTFHAVPVKVAGAAAFPVRAYALTGG